MKNILLPFSDKIVELHNDMLIHLITTLKRRGYKTIFMKFHTVWSTQISSDKINKIKVVTDEYEEMDNYRDYELDDSLEEDIFVLQNIFGKTTFHNFQSYNRMGYRGLSIRAVVDQQIKNLECSAIKSIVEKHKINYVVCANENFNIIQILHLMNIPIVNFAMSNMGVLKEDSDIKFDDADAIMQSDYIATYATLWGIRMKEELLSKGYKNDNLKVIGYLKNDSLFSTLKNINEAEKNNIKIRLGIKKNEKVILLISWGFIAIDFYPDGEKYIKKFFDILDIIKKYLRDGYILVVKPHPFDNVGKNACYYNALKEYMCNKIVVTDSYYNLNTLFLISDIVLGSGSSADKESMVFDKPYVFLNLGFDEAKTEYVKKCGFIINDFKENSIDEIYNLIETDMYKSQRHEYLEREFFRFDGKVCDRLVDLLDKIEK